MGLSVYPCACDPKPLRLHDANDAALGQRIQRDGRTKVVCSILRIERILQLPQIPYKSKSIPWRSARIAP